MVFLVLAHEFSNKVHCFLIAHLLQLILHCFFLKCHFIFQSQCSLPPLRHHLFPAHPLTTPPNGVHWFIFCGYYETINSLFGYYYLDFDHSLSEVLSKRLWTK